MYGIRIVGNGWWLSSANQWTHSACRPKQLIKQCIFSLNLKDANVNDFDVIDFVIVPHPEQFLRAADISNKTPTHWIRSVFETVRSVGTDGSCSNWFQS